MIINDYFLIGINLNKQRKQKVLKEKSKQINSRNSTSLTRILAPTPAPTSTPSFASAIIPSPKGQLKTSTMIDTKTFYLLCEVNCFYRFFFRLNYLSSRELFLCCVCSFIYSSTYAHIHLFIFYPLWHGIFFLLY